MPRTVTGRPRHALCGILGDMAHARFLFFTLAGILAGCLAFADAPTRKSPWEAFRDNWNALKADGRIPFQKSTPASSFGAAKDKLAVVVAGDKTGSGFLLHDGGRVYLFTNAHVVRDAPFVRATRLDGRPLKLGTCDFARNSDLARFELDETYPAFRLETGLPDIGEPIVVLGNSDGRGVVTEIRGRVLGVGPQELEVDAKFVSGNSGSPVLNRSGKVVAIASYLRDCRDDADWSKTDTRFNGIRRFAIRPRGIRWFRPLKTPAPTNDTASRQETPRAE